MAKKVNDIPPGPTAIVAAGTIVGNVPGNRRRKRIRVTGDAAYPTGGYPLLAADFGFSTQIDFVDIVNDGSGDPATAPANMSWYYDTVTQSLELQVPSTGAEVANGTDVHLATTDVVGEGF